MIMMLTEAVDYFLQSDFMMYVQQITKLQRNKLLKGLLEENNDEEAFLLWRLFVGDPCSSNKKGATLNQEPLLGWASMSNKWHIRL